MKLTTLLMCTAGCTLLAATSCKKKNNDQVRNEVIGKWIETSEAKDVNGNGQMDANEVTGPGLYQTCTLSYNADGTLSIYQYNNLAGQKNWSLEYNNTYLKTTDIGSIVNITYQHIDNISATAMTLRDTTKGVIEWYQFTKQ